MTQPAPVVDVPIPFSLDRLLSQQWSGGLLDSIADGLLAIDTRTGAIQHANASALAIIGNSLEHVVGKTLRQIFGDKPGVANFELLFAEVLLGQRAGSFQLAPNVPFAGPGVSVQVFPGPDFAAVVLHNVGEGVSPLARTGNSGGGVEFLASLGNALLAARGIDDIYKALSAELQLAFPGYVSTFLRSTMRRRACISTRSRMLAQLSTC